MLKNQEAENIVENVSVNDEISFSQEAVENSGTNQDSLNDLKEFGVDSEEPDLFSSDNDNSNYDDLLGSSEKDNDDEDDLEIPAFLRRQKN